MQLFTSQKLSGPHRSVCAHLPTTCFSFFFVLRDSAASAAGTVLGEVPRPKGLAAEGKAKPDVVPSADVQPTTPSLGAIMPGALDDPSAPTYGILKE
jgi:hypothetical protein